MRGRRRLLLLLTNQAESRDTLFLRALIPEAKTMIAKSQIPPTCSNLRAEKPNIEAFFWSGVINSVTNSEQNNSRNANKPSRNRYFGSLVGVILEFIFILESFK